MQHWFAALAVALACSFQAAMSRAETAKLPPLATNEAIVEAATAAPAIKINDPVAVFAYVLSQLPERATVYPTENYYYFKFVHDHVPYAGNIRLDVVDRDQGKLHFAYFESLTEWRSGDEPIKHIILDSHHGVTVEKRGALTYRVSHAGKSVTFELIDLRHVKPPAAALGPDEVFIGPVFDESAIRFFLLFNKKLKIFHYVLDETIPVADQLTRIAATDRILIGKRTGFAYYRDHRLDRKILVGVYEGNSRVNNYFDGPFDQLPDNFIDGDTLLDAILAVSPKLKGTIDRFGISPGGEDRYMIAPYMHYGTEDALEAVHTCATDSKTPAAQYYECFVWDDELPDEADDEDSQQAPSTQK